MTSAGGSDKNEAAPETAKARWVSQRPSATDQPRSLGFDALNGSCCRELPFDFDERGMSFSRRKPAPILGARTEQRGAASSVRQVSAPVGRTAYRFRAQPVTLVAALTCGTNLRSEMLSALIGLTMAPRLSCSLMISSSPSMSTCPSKCKCGSSRLMARSAADLAMPNCLAPKSTHSSTLRAA